MFDLNINPEQKRGLVIIFALTIGLGGFYFFKGFSNDPASQKDVFGLELNFPEPEFPKSTAKPLPDGRRWLRH